MNKCRTLHETYLKEIIDTLDTIKNADADDIFSATKRSKMSSTSISRITSNLTLVFPVLVSRSISIQNAMMISKAIERKAIIMLQILFSAYQISDVNNVEDYIRRFHKNINLKNDWTVDDIIRDLDSFSEATCVNPVAVQMIKEDMKNIHFYFDNYDINHTAISDYSIGKKIDGSYNVRSEGYRYDNDEARRDKDSRDAIAKQLLDSDIKKANELVPSTLAVNFIYSDPDSGKEHIPVKDVVIGVKARMIPIDSVDVINHFMIKIEDKNWLLHFFKATTRETSFFRDFLFMIDRAKIDALSRSKRGSSSPMWKILERRARSSKFQRLIGKSNECSAITTVVLSQEEVDFVKKEYGIDFEKFENIGKVMSDYNLMGFVIVDESLEVAKFLFDTGEAMWENIAFSGLEREGNNNDYKKIVNLMTKMSR